MPSAHGLPSIITQQTATAEDLEFIFLGTGTSSSLPQIRCLTAPSNDPVCKTCLSTLTPEGRKNARRNTSALFRVKGADGNLATVVIDVGKTFLASALELFPKYGLRRIDAVLITHAHADAMNGLDDLRGWTLNSSIQKSIDVYASQATYDDVYRAYPYLVDSKFASGGGDVPEFRWHIIEDKQPFQIGNTGITIIPFAVQHGRIFSRPPPPTSLPTPNYTAPPTPVSGRSSPLPSTFIAPNRINSEEPHVVVSPKPEPYLCMGFKIKDSVVYISDVSHIPEDVWSLLVPKGSGRSSRIPVLVLDCLRIQPHTSHFGLKQSMDAVRRFGAQRSYLIGFTHDLTHDEYTEVLRFIEEKQDISNASAAVRSAIELIEGGESQWVRPSYDGLRLFISPDGSVREE